MYGAMRERARNSSQFAGLATAVLMTSAVGYVLANGFIGKVAKFIETPMTLTPILEEQPTPDVKPQAFRIDTPAPTPPIPAPPIPRETFVSEDDGPIVAGRRETALRVEAGTVGGGTERIAPVRTPPALLTRDPPPYPMIEVRRQSEGATGLKVCVDASGRVTSASLASTSGHAALDSAALKWIRNARFAPARSDGLAEARCGHDVVYEWKLENAH